MTRVQFCTTSPLSNITVRSPYLYFALLSCRTLGSRVLCNPSSVLLTASLAPIMGFRTAIGTARITERTGPCKKNYFGSRVDEIQKHTSLPDRS